MWNTPSNKRLDRIPKLYETEGIPLKEKEIFLHFFIGDCDWFICEFDGKDMFWGFVVLNGDIEMSEFGFVSFNELKTIKIGMGIEIDCELEELWKIRPAKEISLICKAQGWHKKVHENQSA